MTLRTHLDGAIFAEHLTGRSPRILALHGWGRNRGDLLDALTGREVISIDLPGFGASPPPPQRWGAGAYSDQIAELLRSVDVGPHLVVGHSFGGRVAAHLAADHPELVQGVVFAGVPLLRLDPVSSTKSPLPYRVVRRARKMHLVPERSLEAMRQRYGSVDYRSAEGVMRDILVTVVNEDYRDQLARIECPVGFCWGADDTAARADVARAAADLVTNCVDLTIVDGAGHDVHRQNPQRFNSVIDTVATAAGHAR